MWWCAEAVACLRRCTAGFELLQERSQAVCDGVRFLLLSMTGGNRGFTLADFKQAITRVKVLGKADAL